MEKNFTINITKKAVTHLKNFINKDNKNTINISIKKKGCSGLTYNIQAIKYVKNSNKYLEYCIEDVIFLIDIIYIKYLQGITIDYIKQEDGLYKLVYINPNETAKCGCGISFYSDK